MTLTIRDIVEQLTAGAISGTEGAGREATVDRLTLGCLDTAVKGIVTTFMASHKVIEQAIALSANLIITHEGIFYSHHEAQEWIKQEPVYAEKSRLIEEAGIGIFRFHDRIHRCQPDGIMHGLLQELGWEQFVVKEDPAYAIVELPRTEVREVAAYVKRKLELSHVRLAGDPTMPCRRVGITVGYRGGGDMSIPLFEQEKVDVLIAGEGPEWETPEYVRDAVQQGRKRALIMLGHAESEAPGMRVLANTLSLQYPGIPVHFIAAPSVYQIL